MTKINRQEQILVPLRELYRRDTNHRKVIPLYANNYKQRGSFLRYEADFLVERLSIHNIDSPPLRVKLLTVELVPTVNKATAQNFVNS